MSQDIPASLVKEIRDKTSAPLLDCKKALEETNGNIEKAIDTLSSNDMFGFVAATKTDENFMSQVL